jgi:hypothetical protein
MPDLRRVIKVPLISGCNDVVKRVGRTGIACKDPRESRIGVHCSRSRVIRKRG